MAVNNGGLAAAERIPARPGQMLKGSYAVFWPNAI